MTSICGTDWLKQKKLPNYKQFPQAIKIVDLFSGCGGLTLGALEACRHRNIRAEVDLAVEFNEIAAKVYQQNFEASLQRMHCGDISALITNDLATEFSETEKSLQSQFQDVDILLAGPPCQGHSRLNNHTRLIDPRNKLYFKVIRFVELCRPKFIIIENVLNVKYDAHGVVDISQDYLSKLGYHVRNLTIKAVEFGIAQNRVRHIQVASIEPIELDLGDYESDKVLSDVIDDLLDTSKENPTLFNTPSVTKHKERIDYLFDNDLYDLPDHLRPDCHKTKSHTYYTSYGRLKWNEPCSTITRGFSTMGQGRFVHPLRRRTLTPHEAARIQGFPDFFSFEAVKKRGELHLMIANAVPPKIGAMLVDQYLIKQMELEYDNKKAS